MSMLLGDILQATASLHSHESKTLVAEIHAREDWRCYPSTLCDDVEQLIERYLRHHATTPGPVSKEMHATRPIEIFGWRHGAATYKGALYFNGAVLQVKRGEEKTLSLFVDEGIAQRWLYPADGWVYTAKMAREKLSE